MNRKSNLVPGEPGASAPGFLRRANNVASRRILLSAMPIAGLIVHLANASAAEPAPAPAGAILVQPASLDLRHPRQPHSLQVLATSADGYSLDLSGQAQFSSADAAVASVDERGWVRPLKTGQTQIS